jgi:hypothetical protein
MKLDETFGGEEPEGPGDRHPVMVTDRGIELEPLRAIDLAQPIQNSAAEPA